MNCSVKRKLLLVIQHVAYQKCKTHFSYTVHCQKAWLETSGTFPASLKTFSGCVTSLFLRFLYFGLRMCIAVILWFFSSFFFLENGCFTLYFHTPWMKNTSCRWVMVKFQLYLIEMKFMSFEHRKLRWDFVLICNRQTLCESVGMVFVYLHTRWMRVWGTRIYYHDLNSSCSKYVQLASFILFRKKAFKDARDLQILYWRTQVNMDVVTKVFIRDKSIHVAKKTLWVQPQKLEWCGHKDYQHFLVMEELGRFFL